MIDYDELIIIKSKTKNVEIARLKESVNFLGQINNEMFLYFALKSLALALFPEFRAKLNRYPAC